MISISPDWRKYLSGQPEYGMGYQKAYVHYLNGSYEIGFIFNASTFIKTTDLSSLSPALLLVEEYRLKLQPGYGSIKTIDLIPRPPETLRGVRRVSTNFSGYVRALNASASENIIKAGQAAEDAPITSTVAGEVFKRFSAYANDFRITDKKGLTPNTFATTAEDAENVKTGRDAVARYALENKQSANKRFTINPAKDTSLKQGITQPAYGEPGGGVEVIFVNGTGDNTVTGPDTIPE